MKITRIFLITSVLVAATGLSHAQTVPAKPFSARLNIILPTSGRTRSFIGSSTGQIGVSYAPRSLAKANFAPRLDFDYGRFSRRGNRIEPISLLVTGLVPVNKRRSLTHGVYLGAGIGAARVSQHTNFSFPGETASGGPITFAYPSNSSKTTFAVKLLVGYNFSPALFGEIGYNKLGKIEVFDPSNTFIQIGARF